MKLSEQIEQECCGTTCFKNDLVNQVVDLERKVEEYEEIIISLTEKRRNEKG